MELKLREMLEREDTEMSKKYITSWERMAMKEGKLEMLRANIAEAVQLRFGLLPSGITEIIGSINDLEILQELHRQAIQCQSLDRFAEHLPAAI